MDLKALYDLFLASSGIATDTRMLSHGNLFFALKGERFDGNQFVQQALDKGALVAVVDDKNIPNHPSLFRVSDTLEALQSLARHHRHQFSIPMLAITGSNGKTTTKELIVAVLDSQYNTLGTKGNLNNHIGVPLTLLQLQPKTEIAVIEMGANHQGEIDNLCQIAEPTHGLITNVGKAHLEGFGGIEGVKKGKSELYRYLKDGIIFVNQADSVLLSLANPNDRKVLYYLQSTDTTNDSGVYGTRLISDEGFLKVAFHGDSGEWVEVQSQLTGRYNLPNLLAAITIGKYFKVPAAKIRMALESYVPGGNRSQLLSHNGGWIMLDAYNANPTSMEAAIRHLIAAPGFRKKAFLGDMFELGAETEEEHQRIADVADHEAIEEVVLVGKHFAEFARKKGWRHFDTAATAQSYFQKLDFSGYLILIKGSRGMQMENLLKEK